MRDFFDRHIGIIYDYTESRIRKKDIWKTAESFTYSVGFPEDKKYVVVPAGFHSDGASVPRMFWWLFPPWGVYGQAAILHDYLCHHRTLTEDLVEGSVILNQKEIDQIFYKAMKSLGTPVWTRGTIYAAVRIYNILRKKT